MKLQRLAWLGWKDVLRVLTSGAVSRFSCSHAHCLWGFTIKLQLLSSPVELSDEDLAHELSVFVSGVSDQAQVVETLMACWSFGRDLRRQSLTIVGGISSLLLG